MEADLEWDARRGRGWLYYASPALEHVTDCVPVGLERVPVEAGGPVWGLRVVDGGDPRAGAVVALSDSIHTKYYHTAGEPRFRLRAVHALTVHMDTETRPP